MRKISTVMTIIMTFVITLSGCGTKGKTDNRTLDDFITAYNEEGIEVDEAEKPMFSLVGATDGVIFYMDSQPVKIYEFKSPGAVKKKQKDIELMKDWDTNGKFLLETSSEEAADIFNSVK